ncbi:MAG: hypothetical protein ACYDDU_18930, partial [Dermatophilaceae bacterium]
ALAAARAGLSHIVTVSYFTAEDNFAAATVVVNDLGEPDSPAKVRAGAQVLNAAGYIDVSSLVHVLEGAD